MNPDPGADLGLFKLDSDRKVVLVRAGDQLAAGEQAFINYAHPMSGAQTPVGGPRQDLRREVAGRRKGLWLW